MGQLAMIEASMVSPWRGDPPLSQTITTLNPGCVLESSGKLKKKIHAQEWILPEMLKPTHWAEDMNSNNSCTSFLSRDEKDITMRWS